MIGLVKGNIDSIRSNHIILDTGSVGYKIIVSATLLAKLKPQDKLRLYTYTYVREDILELFGFESLEQLSLFELILTVSGVGPKTALAVFSQGTSQQITEAILMSDVSFFSGVPRLGKKNAQKIIIELKGKLGDATTTLDFAAQDEEKEIVQALKDFGFKPQEISDVLKKIRGKGNSIEDKMKLALKHLAK
jgi:Holliday junction DNA helicase RuvA